MAEIGPNPWKSMEILQMGLVVMVHSRPARVQAIDFSPTYLNWGLGGGYLGGDPREGKPFGARTPPSFILRNYREAGITWARITWVRKVVVSMVNGQQNIHRVLRLKYAIAQCSYR